jgi:hypothetical protein
VISCLLPSAYCLLVLGELVLVADGELVAALEAPTPEDGASAPGGHPLEEAMLAKPGDSLGLIGSLGHEADSCNTKTAAPSCAAATEEYRRLRRGVSNARRDRR